MNTSSKEEAEKEFNKRLNEWMEADKKYQELIKRYVWSGPVAEGQPIPSPDNIFDTDAIAEIKKISDDLDKAKEELDKATEKLFDTYHK